MFFISIFFSSDTENNNKKNKYDIIIKKLRTFQKFFNNKVSKSGEWNKYFLLL